MADALLREFRHRFNHNISERRHRNFPRLGHYDTWLIDHLQLLVERNHNKLLYPSWPNTADYADTEEKFGVVQIHSVALGKALATIQLRPEVTKTFTSDQIYLCKCMGTPAPFLPLHGEEENKLFSRLVRTTCSDLDMNKMAIEWCKHVDGVEIFPKLPAYLRKHLAVYQKNHRIRESTQNALAGEVVLAQINAETLSSLLTSTGNPASPLIIRPASITSVLPMVDNNNSSIDVPAPHVAHEVSVSYSQHPPLGRAIFPVGHDSHVIVGGMHTGGINLLLQSQPPPTPRLNGQRGGDSKKRKARTCQVCIKKSRLALAHTCKGRSATGTCEYEQV